MPGQGRQMGLFTRSRALRAAMLAALMACFGSPATSLAASLDSPGTATVQADEPFGLATSPVTTGPVYDKWKALARQLDDERVQIALCDGDREHCVSNAALRFLAIVDGGRGRHGLAQVGEINRAVNLTIRPMSDLAQYGQIDYWAPPLISFRHLAGDCEDYAIAKFVALWEAGVPAQDLRIVIMRNIFYGGDHAVAAAKLNGHWLMLDNLHMAMVEDRHVRNFRPLFVIDQSGLERYNHAPLLAAASDRDTAPLAAPVPPIEPSSIAAPTKPAEPASPSGSGQAVSAAADSPRRNISWLMVADEMQVPVTTP